MPEDAKKPNQFQAAQPQIPGVPQPKPLATAKPKVIEAKASSSAKASGGQQARPHLKAIPGYLWACGGGAILLVVVAVIFFMRGSARAAHSAAPVEAAQPTAQPLHTAPVEAEPVAPGRVATTEELAQPWVAKQFLYRTGTGGTIPAMVVHLTGNTYWAFSLKEPYGSCTLEYVTDLNKLRDEYAVRSSRPLLVDPCSHTVYDLTRYANGPNGLVRGAIITGTGMRPPYAIEVQVSGNEILATRAEPEQ
jgi:hypothetical protein